jgi:hypothetical protein
MRSPKDLKIQRDYSAARLQTLLPQLVRETPTGIRAAVNVLRVGTWFEALRWQAGEPSAYGVGKRVQPHTYRPRDGGKWPQHNNLWAKYARGLHLPGPDTVAAAERVAPGSSGILHTAAWEAFDVSAPIRGGGDALLRKLRFGVQRAVYIPRPLALGKVVRRSGSQLSLRMLEDQADLDSLAALVVLLREAHEAGDGDRALEIGKSLHKSLLIVTITSHFAALWAELFEFLKRLIFPMASDGNVAFDLDRDEFGAQRKYLNRVFLQMEDAGRFQYVSHSTRDLRKIVSGDYGLDLLFGLSPRLKLVRSAEHSSIDARRRLAWLQVARDWGLSVLRRGGCERVPPDEVITAMAEAREVLGSMGPNSTSKTGSGADGHPTQFAGTCRSKVKKKNGQRRGRGD